MSKKALGTLLVSVSACSFGTYSYFALLATGGPHGTNALTLLMLRFGIAGVILGAMALAMRSVWPSCTKGLQLAGLGLLYVGQAFTYLQCLLTSSAITASLLLYLYPAFVTIGSVLFLHEKLTRVKVIALVCALAGSVLIIGPVAEIRPVAIVYGIGTACFYAAYLVAGKRVLQEQDPVSSTLTIIATAFVAFALLAVATGLRLPTAAQPWIGVVGLAVVATVIAIGGLLAGLKWISPVEASSLSALEPLVTAIIAVSVLGQQAHWWHVAGGALVIIAVVTLARQAAETPHPSSASLHRPSPQEERGER